MDFYKWLSLNQTGLDVIQKARKRRHTCGLSSFQRLAALLSHHGVDVDHVLGQRVEALEDHRDLSTIHKHLIQEGRLEESWLFLQHLWHKAFIRQGVSVCRYFLKIYGSLLYVYMREYIFCGLIRYRYKCERRMEYLWEAIIDLET